MVGLFDFVLFLSAHTRTAFTTATNGHDQEVD
jgi:hypothetical protein